MPALLALVHGTVLHDVTAENRRHHKEGASFDEDEALDLLESAFLVEEAGGEITSGKLDRNAVVNRLRRLYEHWNEEFVSRVRSSRSKRNFESSYRASTCRYSAA